MNFLKRIFRSRINTKNCVLGEGSKLTKEARILNNLGIREAITVGRNTNILGAMMQFGHGGEIRIGDECYVSQGTRIWSAKSITILSTVVPTVSSGNVIKESTG